MGALSMVWMPSFRNRKRMHCPLPDLPAIRAFPLAGKKDGGRIPDGKVAGGKGLLHPARERHLPLRHSFHRAALCARESLPPEKETRMLPARESQYRDDAGRTARCCPRKRRNSPPSSRLVMLREREPRALQPRAGEDAARAREPFPFPTGARSSMLPARARERERERERESTLEVFVQEERRKPPPSPFVRRTPADAIVRKRDTPFVGRGTR